MSTKENGGQELKGDISDISTRNLKPKRLTCRKQLRFMENLQDIEFTFDWISGYWPNWKKLIPNPINGHYNILEIGSFEGLSTCFFLNYFHGSVITCIDTFEGGADHVNLGISFSDVEKRFIGNTMPFANRVSVLKGRSSDKLRTFPEQPVFDIVFVDGSHLAADVLSDLVLSWPLLKVGGYMIMDDYLWNGGRPLLETPRPAIDAFFAIHQPSVKTLDVGYQVILQKTK